MSYTYTFKTHFIAFTVDYVIKWWGGVNVGARK